MKPADAIKGRGTALNPPGRFESTCSEPVDDGWPADACDVSDAGEISPATRLHRDQTRSIISRNASPDVPFSQSINPYRGCEHGCVYCYARPSHAYLNLSPGLDFETELFYKPDAAALLDAELRKPGYQPSVIALGANTDPYQPVERRLGITRALLEVLLRFRHPVIIVTKGAALIERDLDLLRELAALGLVRVAVSLTTLRPGLKRTLEPRAASASARLRAMRQLSAAGVPVTVLFSPVIPRINDDEMEAVLAAAREAGAAQAHYILLRLPHEVKDLFRQWLDVHEPGKAAHVMSLIRQMRGGADYDADFAQRMAGQGAFAELLAQRFAVACRRLGLGMRQTDGLDHSRFRVPERPGDQLSLFGG